MAKTTTPKDAFSERAAKGQAYNLAVLTAIADCKQHDNKYILKQYFRHREMAALIQETDETTLVQAVENPQLLELFKTMQSLLY